MAKYRGSRGRSLSKSDTFQTDIDCFIQDDTGLAPV
jgi:hypothetical protein